MGTINRNPRHNFFKEALRSLMHDTDFSTDVPMSAQDIDTVIRSGLGPVFYHLLARSGVASEIDRHMKLKAADITARVLTAEQSQNIIRTIETLRINDVDVVILKGTSFALNFYPEPHLRTMGDVDLLLPPEKITASEQALVNDGFQKKEPQPGFDYDKHIHSAPLFHAERKIWIELHRSLLPTRFPSSQESPLNLDAIKMNIQQTNFGPHVVHRFRPEFELLYLANGWCFDLTRGIGPGLRRSLVDCTLLLKIADPHMDWDTVLRWSKDTLSGACLLVLLSYLVRSGVYADHRNICESLLRNQNYVTSLTLRIMHSRIEKHLVLFEAFGPVLTSRVTASLFDAMIRKNAAWKNILAIPGSILFPRREPRRYQLRYQLDRLGNAMKRK